MNHFKADERRIFHYLVIILLSVVSLCLSSLWAMKLPTHATDSFMYLWQATLLSESPIQEWGKLISVFPKGFYSVLITLASLWRIDIEMAGILVSLISGVFSVLFTGMITMRLSRSDETISKHKFLFPILASSILAFHPIFIDYSGRILSESLFIALSMIAMLLILRMIDTGRFRWMIAASLIVGLITLTREIGIAYIPLLGIMPFLCHVSWFRKIAMMFAGTVIAISINMPLFLSGSQSSWGQLNLTGHKAGFDDILSREREMFELNDSATKFKIDERSNISMISMIKTNLLPMTQRIDSNFSKLLLVMWRLTGSNTLILALLGMLLFCLTIIRQPNRLVVLLFAAVNLFGYLPFHIEFRYLVPVLPFVSIFASYAIMKIVNVARRTQILTSIIVCFFCLLVCYSHYRTLTVQTLPELAPVNNLIEERELGLKLKTLIPPESLIMARKPDVPYYSDSNFVLLPFAEWPEIYKFACSKGVNYLVLSRRFLPRRPMLASLYNPTSLHVGLELMLPYTASNGIQFYVYRVNCPERTEAAASRQSNPLGLFGH